MELQRYNSLSTRGGASLEGTGEIDTLIFSDGNTLGEVQFSLENLCASAQGFHEINALLLMSTSHLPEYFNKGIVHEGPLTYTTLEKMMLQSDTRIKGLLEQWGAKNAEIDQEIASLSLIGRVKMNILNMLDSTSIIVGISTIGPDKSVEKVLISSPYKRNLKHFPGLQRELEYISSLGQLTQKLHLTLLAYAHAAKLTPEMEQEISEVFVILDTIYKLDAISVRPAYDDEILTRIEKLKPKLDKLATDSYEKREVLAEANLELKVLEVQSAKKKLLQEIQGLYVLSGDHCSDALKKELEYVAQLVKGREERLIAAIAKNPLLRMTEMPKNILAGILQKIAEMQAKVVREQSELIEGKALPVGTDTTLTIPGTLSHIEALLGESNADLEALAHEE